MDAVRAGIGATIQPGAATLRNTDPALSRIELAGRLAKRRSVVASLSDEELSPAALAARVTLVKTARALVKDDRWPGGALHDR